MGAQQGKLAESLIIGSEERTDEYQDNDEYKSIPECLMYQARTKPDHDALVFYSTDEPRLSVTFKELYDNSCKMASVFMEMGLQTGETVVIVSRNCPEWYYCAIGAMMLQAKVITTHFKYSDGSDFVKLIDKLADCAILVFDPGREDSNLKIIGQLVDTLTEDGRMTSSEMPYLRNLILLTNTENSQKRYKTVEELLLTHKPMKPKKICSTTTAMIFQTSGSTGEPKLVAFTHENLLKIRYLFRYTGIGEELNCFNDRPFFWISSFMLDTLKGYKRTSISGMCPEPSDYIGFLMHVIQSEKCNYAFLLPSAIYEIAKRKNEIDSDWSLETVTTGGQPITKSLTSCIGTICTRLCVVYGASEFLIGSGLIVEESHNFADYSSGRPASGCELKIVNEQGEIVPVGESGEIYLKAKWMFTEYVNDAEKTKAAKTEDDWYKTDDQGRIDSNGVLFVEGRKSDIIICGVKKVAPFILEAVLKAHPDVDDAIVVPVPDEELYQVICACVKIDRKSDLTENALREYIVQTHEDKTGLFTALPKYYMIIDEVPREHTGKVSRKTLKSMAEEKFCNRDRKMQLLI